MSHQIKLWQVPLHLTIAPSSDDWLLLSELEQSRAARFYRDTDRHAYIRSHAALRRILSIETAIPPDELQFGSAKSGKPELINSTAPIYFNLSHSYELALVAVSTEGEVGIDVEHCQPVDDLDGLLQQVCTLTERIVINSAPDPLDAFYRCWVGKEATLKCIGTGLTTPLDNLVVLDAHGTLLERPVLPYEIGDVSYLVLNQIDELPLGYTAAVAAICNSQNDFTKVELQGRIIKAEPSPSPDG